MYSGAGGGIEKMRCFTCKTPRRVLRLRIAVLIYRSGPLPSEHPMRWPGDPAGVGESLVYVEGGRVGTTARPGPGPSQRINLPFPINSRHKPGTLNPPEPARCPDKKTQCTHATPHALLIFPADPGRMYSGDLDREWDTGRGRSGRYILWPQESPGDHPVPALRPGIFCAFFPHSDREIVPAPAYPEKKQRCSVPLRRNSRRRHEPGLRGARADNTEKTFFPAVQ